MYKKDQYHNDKKHRQNKTGNTKEEEQGRNSRRKSVAKEGV